ncbi:MAG: mannose-6-phosphate isomerase [Candidatus Nanoarchaeia archaeon]
MKEVQKPWGKEKHFSKNEKSTVKILEVNPHQKLSLQKHKKRRELWYFLTNGYVQLSKNGKERHIRKNKIVNIPKGRAHRLLSKNKKVKVLEISYGKFEQNDEIRLEDKYGRG